MNIRSRGAPFIGAAITLFLALLVLIPNLGGNFAEDDEGAYMYIAWRLANGDTLYEELPTSKPPLTFLVGALVVRAFGPDALALRFASALAFACAAAALYLAASRMALFRHAWIAPLVFVLHPDAFMQGRLFRPDVFAILFTTIGLILALMIARAPKPSSRLALIAGLAFGLALLCKLNAALSLVIAAMLVVSARRWKELGLMIAVALGFGALVAIWYQATTQSDLFDLTVGHHVRQTADVHPGERVKAFLRENVAVVLICFATFLRGAPAGDREVRAWRVLGLAMAGSLGIFFFVGREVFMRHFLYLAPCIALLAPPAVESAAARLREMLPAGVIKERVREGALVFLLLTMLAVTWEWPAQRAYKAEGTGFRELSEGVASALGAETRVLADYAIVNLLAERKGLVVTSQLSNGAIQAGQVDTERLLNEIDASRPGVVLIHRAGEYGYRYGVLDKVLSPSHLVALPDFDSFRAGVEARAHEMRWVTCGSLHFELWVLREDVQLPSDWGPRCEWTPSNPAELLESAEWRR